jgi:hypothetical protein
MPSISHQDGLDRVELLTAELRAIEHWDADYWRKARPEVYETLAYTARRERLAEILSQLSSLIRDLTRRADCGNNASVNTLPRRAFSALMSVYRNKTQIVPACLGGPQLRC